MDSTVTPLASGQLIQLPANNDSILGPPPANFGQLPRAMPQAGTSVTALQQSSIINNPLQPATALVNSNNPLFTVASNVGPSTSGTVVHSGLSTVNHPGAVPSGLTSLPTTSSGLSSTVNYPGAQQQDTPPTSNTGASSTSYYPAGATALSGIVPLQQQQSVATPQSHTPRGVAQPLQQPAVVGTQVQSQGQQASPSPFTLMPLPPPPPASQASRQGLPKNWQTAQDATGKVYYYHSITRKTQWDRPTEQDEGTITMELETPSSGEEEEVGVVCD